MVKFVYLKFWAFILGLAALPMSIRDSRAAADLRSEITNDTTQEHNMLFMEPYLDDSSSFQVAGHRSHRSHSSHRSHYSSRGSYGGSYRSPSTYTSPSYAVPSAVTIPAVQSLPVISSDATTDTLVLEIQIKLRSLGFFEGIVDGVYGKKTRNAIILYQVDKGLTPDGQATQELLDHIKTYAK